MEKMNRSQVVAAVSERLRMSQATVRAVIDAFLEEVERALRRRREVRLSGFGAFVMRRRGARPGRNLRSGEVIVQPEQEVPVFRSSEKMRQRVAKAISMEGENGNGAE
ncbi:HU family DNA-binding protein [Dolichospermum phage Dfl-JY45]